MMVMLLESIHLPHWPFGLSCKLWLVPKSGGTFGTEHDPMQTLCIRPFVAQCIDRMRNM